ncbi:hypothetical protein VPNG_09181 [Cytospora leucostoma]|uniref:Uncharacterized protein n=1 Tax=Cytospora leucostoma TaxID=1230097 RepID=A0A423VUC0_9PEZI|nr:hypothetical protein VPNG_09181 [Cytospora leucostoma]
MILNQPNMAVQEDLASLFAKNMTLNAAQQPAPPPPQDDNKIIYISQHYNHSAHIMQQKQQQQQQQQQQQPQSPQDEPMQRPSSEPPRSDLQDLELLLRSHGVNTAALSLPQVELFRSAGDAQRLRLIQLWTICPPADSADNPTLTWATTTVEQEELLAQRRLELQQQQQRAGPAPVTEVVMSLDGTETETTLGSSPAASSMQSADGRWPPLSQIHHMEPYMQSGYEELARREYEASAARGAGAGAGAGQYKPATDPVYGATGGVVDWDRQQWMESQYGSIVAWGEDEEML